jgi:hypothetical protein
MDELLGLARWLPNGKAIALAIRLAHLSYVPPSHLPYAV